MALSMFPRKKYLITSPIGIMEKLIKSAGESDLKGHVFWGKGKESTEFHPLEFKKSSNGTSRIIVHDRKQGVVLDIDPKSPEAASYRWCFYNALFGVALYTESEGIITIDLAALAAMPAVVIGSEATKS